MCVRACILCVSVTCVGVCVCVCACGESVCVCAGVRECVCGV